MMRLVRYSLFALVLTGLVQGALHVVPMLTAPDGLLGSLVEPFKTYVAMAQNNEDLSQRTDLLVRRIELKTQITQLLVKGEISFEQATDQFVEVTVQTKLPEEAAVPSPMVRSSRQEYATNVMTWLAMELSKRPGSKRILRKYETEFGKHYHSLPST